MELPVLFAVCGSNRFDWTGHHRHHSLINQTEVLFFRWYSGLVVSPCVVDVVVRVLFPSSNLHADRRRKAGAFTLFSFRKPYLNFVSTSAYSHTSLARS